MKVFKNIIRYMFVACIPMYFGLTQVRTQTLPPPRHLTDEEQIRIILNKIEQGIKEQNILKVTDGFARVFQHGDSTSARFLLWGRLKHIFDQSQGRWDDSLFQTLTPTSGNLTGTWDFELEIDTLRILNDNNAQVKAWIYFGASPADTTTDWKFGKKHRENIMFKKIGGEWRVKGVDKLLKVLRKYGNT